MNKKEILDKLLELESIQSNEWRYKKSILCRKTAEILRDSAEFKEWLSTVPNDFAYLPYDIAEDIVHQNSLKSVENLVACNGVWGQAVANVRIATLHDNLMVKMVTVDGTVTRAYDPEADKKLIFRETILEAPNLGNYVDLAPRMCGILKVTCRKLKSHEEELFFNGLSTKFSRISIDLSSGGIPDYVERFLSRAVYGRHLRSLSINQKSEQLLQKLEFFVKKENFESLETSFKLPYSIFEAAYRTWQERTFFQTAKQRFEFEVDEETFCMILSLFFDWTEDEGIHFDYGFANIERYNTYYWRKERHPLVEGIIVEMALRTRDVTDAPTYTVLMIMEEGDAEDVDDGHGLLDLARRVRAEPDSYFCDDDDI